MQSEYFNSFWITEIELKLIAKCFNVTLQILYITCSKGKNMYSFNTYYADQPISTVASMLCHYDHFSALLPDETDNKPARPQCNSYLSNFPPLPGQVKQETKPVKSSKPDMKEIERWVDRESRRRDTGTNI